jgi:hypothetical protein
MEITWKEIVYALMYRMALTAPIVTKLTNPQLHCVEIYYSEFTQLDQEIWELYYESKFTYALE